jgi:hypothetical protein
VLVVSSTPQVAEGSNELLAIRDELSWLFRQEPIVSLQACPTLVEHNSECVWKLEDYLPDFFVEEQ